MGEMVAGEGDFGQSGVGTMGGGWVSVCVRRTGEGAREREGGTPILAFPREGGGKGGGSPHSRGNGRGARGAGIFHGGMVAGEGDFGQWEVGTMGGGWDGFPCARGEREGGMGCVCAGETGGGTPILAFPREGGREGIGEGGGGMGPRIREETGGGRGNGGRWG